MKPKPPVYETQAAADAAPRPAVVAAAAAATVVLSLAGAAVAATVAATVAVAFVGLPCVMARKNSELPSPPPLPPRPLCVLGHDALYNHRRLHPGQLLAAGHVLPARRPQGQHGGGGPTADPPARDEPDAINVANAACSRSTTSRTACALEKADSCSAPSLYEKLIRRSQARHEQHRAHPARVLRPSSSAR